MKQTVDYNEKTDELTFTTTQDRMPILQANDAERMSAEAATMGQGLGRKIASIDLVTVQEAAKLGYDLFKRSDLMAFLAKHPEYRTVRGVATSQGMDSGRSGHIIVK